MAFAQENSEFEKAITELFKKMSAFYKDVVADFDKNTLNSIEYLQTEFGIKGSNFASIHLI
jgi:hypothetical protein